MKSQTFLQNQKKYERVEKAFNEKEALLKYEFDKQNLSWPPQEIYLRSFKADACLEVWVKEQEKFELFKKYDICRNSGNFGPKRKEGDMQVPEGFYHIEVFNPVSSFWLSLGINYPNESDKILSDKIRPGGDIYIHGDCVTIGCLPMTDDKMKEIYVLASLAQNAGQEKIPVHLFPFRFNMLNNYIFKKEFPEQKKFWENLEEMYTHFEENKQLKKFKIDHKGNYIFFAENQ